MAEDSQSLLARVLEIAARTLDPKRVADARRRQADMFAWRSSDYVPLVFWTPVEATRGMPEFDWARQFADPAASLYMQLKNVVLPQAQAGSDYVPAVRADTGVVNGPSILGAPYEVPAHTKPVVNGHVPADKLKGFRVPDDISGCGTMPIMLEHMRCHRAALERAGLYGLIGLHHCDLQGPFDIIAQARGHDEIFLDLYTDGPFVHDLMEKGTDIYIKMARLCKTLAGVPTDSGHANEYWMDKGSVRICDDSGILVSPALYAQYLAPYLGRALEPFGGGWIHYCGGIPDGNRPEGLHLHELYLSTPRMRGLQFTTGKDLPGEIRKLIARRVVYLGGLPRGPGGTACSQAVSSRDAAPEPLGNYFRRGLSLCPGRVGMIFSADIRPGEHPAAHETWHKLQDELFR